jgi:hypothetical protein
MWSVFAFKKRHKKEVGFNKKEKGKKEVTTIQQSQISQ